jgi:UDP-GlcNAc:undecaprenyl-phosphate GlcNAc-1-phosphate transferase
LRSAGAAFLLSTIVAAILTPIIRRLAIRNGLLDHAIEARKIHGKPIPRLGGIAIVAAFYVPLIGMAIYATAVGQLFYAQMKSAAALMVGGLVIACLGVWDDVRGTGAAKKFAVQIALAVVLYFLGYRIDQIATPFGHPVSLGFLALPFTVLWVVGVINALNLIDGMDGLASGVALFAVGATFLIAFYRNDPLMMLLMACLGGGVLGFLFYNFNPASIFMGDTGSMFLGVILALSSIRTSQKSSTAVAILVPIVGLGLPIADTLAAIVRRAMSGRPLFRADKEHIHHRLLELGLSQRKAVLVLYVACVVLAGTALLLTFASSAQAALILAVLGLAFIVSMRRLGMLQFERAGEALERRRRNTRLRQAVRVARRQLTGGSGPEAVWQVVQSLQEPLDVTVVSLTINGARDVAVRHFATAPVPEDASGYCRVFEVQDDHQCLGELRLWWTDGRMKLDRDDEIGIELLCEYLADALAPAVEDVPHSRSKVRPAVRV